MSTSDNPDITPAPTPGPDPAPVTDPTPAPAAPAPADPGPATDPATPAPTPGPGSDPAAAPPAPDPTPAPTDTGSSTDDLLQQIITSQQEQRAEISALKADIDQAKAAPAPGPPQTASSADDLRGQRLEVLAEVEFYCPGCGRTGDYHQKCEGTGEAPHPPIEMVSADEVKNAPDPSNTEATREWEAGHTPAPSTGTP